VATGKLEAVEDAWRRNTWRDIGAALLVAPQDTLTAPELAGLLRRDASNVKKDAEALVELGALKRCPAPERPSTVRGKKPDASYQLVAIQSLEAALDVELPTGQVRSGQQFVFIDALSDPLEVSSVLGNAEGLTKAAWYSTCDGDTQECLVVFDGEHATSDALDLMAILAGARIPARRAVIGDVGSIAQLAQLSRRRERLGRRARLASDTRRAASLP
jgi:hypothetical protein